MNYPDDDDEDDLRGRPINMNQIDEDNHGWFCLFSLPPPQAQAIAIAMYSSLHMLVHI